MNKIYIYTLVFVCIVGLYVAWRMYSYNHDITVHTVDGYTIWEIENVLSGEECDEIIQYCVSHNMQNSEVVGENGNRVIDTQRKSKTIWIEYTDHSVAMKMANKSAALTNYPRNHQEKLQVVCYATGGKFDAHYDNDYNTEVSTRCATLLVYLNDDFEGGETEFVKIGITMKPKKGKGVLFWSLDDTHRLLDNSMHRANPVSSGKKWICTKWTHINPYSYE